MCYISTCLTTPQCFRISFRKPDGIDDPIEVFVQSRLAEGFLSGAKIRILNFLHLSIKEPWLMDITPITEIPDSHPLPAYLSNDVVLFLKPDGKTCEVHLHNHLKNQVYILQIPHEIVDMDSDGRAVRKLLEHIIRDWMKEHAKDQKTTDSMDTIPDNWFTRYGIHLDSRLKPVLIIHE